VESRVCGITARGRRLRAKDLPDETPEWIGRRGWERSVEPLQKGNEILNHRLTAASEFANLLVQNRRRNDAVVEVAAIQLLVGRVCVLVRKSDAEKH